MSWTKVSEVKVGSKIELQGREFDVKSNTITDLVLINAVGREVKASKVVDDSGDDWNKNEHKIFVLRTGATQQVDLSWSSGKVWNAQLKGYVYPEKAVKPADLATLLRGQIAAKQFPPVVVDKVSLTDSLRCQLAQKVAPEAFAATRDLVGAQFAVRGEVIKPDPRISQQDVKIAAINAKVEGTTAALKAQVAQANLRANEAVYGIQALSDEVDELVDQTNDAFEEVEEAIEIVASDLEDGLFALEGTLSDIEIRLAALEESEEKRQLQTLFNEKIANKTVAQPAQGGKKSMSNLLGNFKGLFGKVEGQFALSLFGGIAIRKNGLGGSWVTYDAKNGITDVQDNVITKFDVPAFKLPVAAGELKVGDIVVNNGAYQYVTEVNDGYVKTINPSTASYGSVIPVRNPLLGKAFYTSVKVIDFTNAGGAAQAGGFNPMLLMALSGDKGGDKSSLLPLLLASGGLGGTAGGAIDPMLLMMLGDNTDDLLPFILLQQGGISGANGLNPLLLMALSGDKNDKSKKDLLPLLLASGGLGGAQTAGGINPMLLMALSGDGDMSDMLPLLLMSGGLNQAPVALVTAPTAPAAPTKA